MIVVGAGGVLLPLLGMALLALLAMSSEFPWGEEAYAFGSLAFLSAAVGAWIGWQGISGLSRRTSQAFRIPARWLWMTAFAALLAFLATAESVGTAASSVLRILAAVLPACALLSLVSHRLKDAPTPATWRQVAAQVGSTLTVAIGWSALWEFLVVVVIAAVAALLLGSSTPELFQDWGQSLEAPSIEVGTRIFRQPGALALILAIVAGAIPVIEEIGKILAVGTLFLVRRPSRAQALTWGIVSGTAFGVYEAALANPFTDAGVGAAVAVARVGALLIHSCATGIISLGLYEWVEQRRPGRFFGSLGMGIGLHAVWNALAIGLNAAMSLGGSQPGILLVIPLGTFFVLSAGAGLVLHRIMEL